MNWIENKLEKPRLNLDVLCHVRMSVHKGEWFYYNIVLSWTGIEWLDNSLEEWIEDEYNEITHWVIINDPKV